MKFELEEDDELYQMIAPDGIVSEPSCYYDTCTIEHQGRVYAAFLKGHDTDRHIVYDITDGLAQARPMETSWSDVEGIEPPEDDEDEEDEETEPIEVTSERIG